MVMRNPYAVLGVSRSASLPEIRAAFRACAIEHHPDTGGTSDPERFIEARRAYDLLSDADARRAFDEASAPYSERRHAAQFTSPPVDILSRPYSDLRSARAFAPPLTVTAAAESALLDASLDELDLLASGYVHEGRAAPSERLVFDLVLDPDEAARGGRFSFTIPLRHRCRACGGTGARWGALCATCDGRGQLLVDAQLHVLVPPGAHDGQQATLPLAHLGLPRGELTVTVCIDHGATAHH